MRNKLLLLIVMIVSVLATLFFVWGVLAGSSDPPNPPANTYSYTLEDIYQRLSAGAVGAQSVFTEPVTAPGTSAMHTLNDIMAQAPVPDNTNGATTAHVLAGKTLWGLTSGQWGVITGAMPDRGAVTLTPTTTNQSIAAGYHNGSGLVQGDADLTADNIKRGVNLFGVVGISPIVVRTGQTVTFSIGDDGDLEKGAAWPSPRFTDNSNGTVTDNLTGLVWLKNANCFGSRTWATALSDANALNSGECSLSDDSSAGDWWLPNVRELQSLSIIASLSLLYRLDIPLPASSTLTIGRALPTASRQLRPGL